MGVVLLVEDDPALRRVVLGSLAAAGHTIVEAADRPRAIAQIGAARPEVIITDRLTSRPTDEELVQALVRSGCTSDNPEIVYIGGRIDNDPCRSDHPPVAACLPKRVSPYTLRSVVQVLLGGPGPH